MLKLRRLSLVFIHFQIFFHRFVHLETYVDFYKRHHLLQAGENTFACVGHSIELKWRYHYSDHVKTVWAKERDENQINLASCSNNVFTLDAQAGTLGFSSPARLSSNDCATLVINSAEEKDEGLYLITVTTTDPERPVKSGNTTLYIYEDCPDVSYPQLSISCEVNTSSSSSSGSSVKTTDFTYRDIVVLSVRIPSAAFVLRRFYYQEQQHTIVQQPIRAKCYNRDDCDVVQWTMSQKSLSLAFFDKNPYLNMTLFVRLYHKKVLLSQLNTTFRFVDPESEKGRSLAKCKAQETDAGEGRPLLWNVALLTSLTLAVSNLIDHINLLS